MKKYFKRKFSCNDIVSIISDSAFILLLFILLTVLISSVFFILKISITNWTILIASFITIWFIWYKNKDKPLTALSILLACFLMFFSVFICKHTYDLSYDGNTYHKLAIGLLADGYNPVYESVSDFIKSGNASVDIQVKDSMWVEHYPKASWIFSANMYKYTGNIESAKIIVMLMIYICFGLGLGFFYKKINFVFSFLLSIFMAVNPVSIVQVFTNYVDGLMGLLLCIILISLCALSSDDKFDKLEIKKYWIILACSIILCLNLKFTGIPYAGLFCIMFFILWLYKAYKAGEFKVKFKNYMKYYISVVAIALLLVGFAPYVKNTINKHNPLYPLIGKDKVDIMTHNSPVSFPNRGALDKFFTSIYAKPANYKANTSDKDPELRIPFVTNKEEIALFKSPDLRISGFGVFFSGIFTISVVVIIIYLIKLYKKKDYEIANYILGFLIVSFILVLITDGSWWARYTPYIYLFPILAMYLLLRDNKVLGKVISVIIMLLLVYNNGTILYTSVNLYMDNYVKINQALIKMKRISKKKGYVNVALREPNFTSQLYNMKDKKIKVNIVSNKDNLKKPIYVNYFYYSN